VKAAR